MALLSSLSYNQFINKGLFKKQNKTSNEIPRRKSSSAHRFDACADD